MMKFIVNDPIHQRLIWQILHQKWTSEWLLESDGRGILEMSEPFLRDNKAKLVLPGGPFEFDSEADYLLFVLRFL